MPRRVRNQVGEALHGDLVAIVHVGPNGRFKRHHARHKGIHIEGDRAFLGVVHHTVKSA
jgi:hypothetical protein